MKNKPDIGLSPLTNEIYIGRLKNGLWTGGTHNITQEAESVVLGRYVQFHKQSQHNSFPLVSDTQFELGNYIVTISVMEKER